jgi:hypothetical protein
MCEPCLVDNDVVLKVAAYKLNDSVVGLLTLETVAPAMLGVGRFVVRQKAARKTRFINSDVVVASTEDLIKKLQLIEPTETETELAAELETLALSSQLALDTGEAQLLAILITRQAPVLITGDKRAIVGMHKLGAAVPPKRVACLEQIVSILVASASLDALRSQICGEPQVDKTHSICFSCASFGSTSIEKVDVLAALQSYANDLRKNSGEVLMADERLLALTT